VEAAGLALERARDHPAHGVLAGHHLTRGLARRVELRLREHVDVRRELKHRVGRRVEDDLAGLEVVRAPVLDDLGAAVGLVAAEAQAGRLLDPLDHLGREAVRIGRQRMIRDHAHQLPVPGGRLLAGTERMEAAMDHRVLRGRHSLDRDDVAEPEAAERREIEPANPFGDVSERVRAGVAVVRGVGQFAHSAGIHHDHGRTWHCAAIMSIATFAILKG
jgi:hypothetical protein